MQSILACITFSLLGGVLSSRTASAQSPAPAQEETPVKADAPAKPAPAESSATSDVENTIVQKRNEQVPTSVSGNPAADNVVPGTGFLGRALGFDENSGLRFGGMWLGDSNGLINGGQNPGKWSWNSLLVLGLNVDAEKLMGLRGASFATQFMQVDTQPTNGQAGSIQGYNSLDSSAGTVVDRSQLYQVWYRQKLFDDKVNIRIGKQVPTYDFANVSRPVSESDDLLMIPAVTGLLYTPIYVNPSMLGPIGGYYNSVYGVCVGVETTDNSYVRFGVYDGNLANGVQTGLTGPEFNSYTYSIAETGLDWVINGEYPGEFGIGGWYQTGQLEVTKSNGDLVSQNGTGGVYFFGGQRVWSNGEKSEGKTAPEQSISTFIQYGVNNSDTMLMNQSIGGGLTGFGLMPSRPRDSMGIGSSLAWLNPNLFQRSSELMFQTYYQFNVTDGVFFQPALTYIPTPGANPTDSNSFALPFRLTMLF